MSPSELEPLENIVKRMNEARKLLNHPDKNVSLKANMTLHCGYMQLELRKVESPFAWLSRVAERGYTDA